MLREMRFRLSSPTMGACDNGEWIRTFDIAQVIEGGNILWI